MGKKHHLLEFTGDRTQNRLQGCLVGLQQVKSTLNIALTRSGIGQHYPPGSLVAVHSGAHQRNLRFGLKLDFICLLPPLAALNHP
jgi:hypothetical protein